MKLNSLKKSLFQVAGISLAITLTTPVYSQSKKKKKGGTEAVSQKKDDKKSIDELIKKSQKFEGLFTLYQDSISGDVKMLVKEDQLNKEYIYFSQSMDGIVDVGGFRGGYRSSKVVKVQKYFDRIEFVEENTTSYFDPENAISKSANANMPPAVLASLPIEAYNKDKTHYLIDANKLFLSETFDQVKPSRNPKASPFSFSIGNLDKEKTKFKRLKNYPENTDLEVEYVYSQPSYINPGSRGVTDARNVSLVIYHSIIEMPQNDYTPLIDDPRIGYFTTMVTDMTSSDFANYRDLVHRWNLVKKDPNAELSEPVEPITWWMENTTPQAMRPIIERAALQWNIAFEKAGFKNAIVVKQQPDDADWDAGDIRYNVLRWTSSPNPPFGGYGPSFVNPRTGEILGADIMFEFRSVLGQASFERLYSKATIENMFSEIEALECNEHHCDISAYSASNNAFAGLVLNYVDGVDFENSEMIEEFIHYLILHEIGHTLGLNHNMKSSQMHSLKTVHNKEITEKVGLIGSVMDYPSVNVAKNRDQQGNYYTMRPGPYDLWAIQFAYEQGRTPEETKALLDRSTEPELVFGNDADDMRAAGKGIDPRVNIFDLSSDAVKYASERLDLVKEIAKEIPTKYGEEGESYNDFFVAFGMLHRQYFDAANVISRYIGGVYVDRAFIGQDGATVPFTAVPLANQKEAMTALSAYIFAPDAFDFSADLYRYIQRQRRGFNFFMTSEDPKLHNLVENIQATAINHILHPNTLQRIVDSELYGNEYSLSTMMTDLTNAIFIADIKGNVNTMRQNLQMYYTNVLIKMLVGPESKRYNSVAQSHAMYFLKEIKKMASNAAGDISTKAHKQHLITLIDNALDEVK